MHKLADYLYPALPTGRSAREIISWWESRRLAYNLAVGAAGVISLTAIAAAGSLLLSGEEPFSPWFLVIVYGVLANVCYCAGALTEILFGRWWGDAVLPVGPLLFRHGLTFSVGLTLLPGAGAVVVLLASAVHALFGGGSL